MVKKLTGKAGMSLMEMMASLLILVLLVVGMNTGMTAGLRVYESSKVTNDRAMLTSSINTKLIDILRYSEVRKADNQYLFTNLEYGLWDVNFAEDANGIIQVSFWDKAGKQKTKADTPLINSSSYSVFKVDTLQVMPKSDEKGSYFDISYTLINTGNNTSTSINAVVRVMND